MCGVVFFFFKQKTAYEMRISDWSSDVCSSDLGASRETLPEESAGVKCKPFRTNVFSTNARELENGGEAWIPADSGGVQGAGRKENGPPGCRRAAVPEVLSGVRLLVLVVVTLLALAGGFGDCRAEDVAQAGPGLGSSEEHTSEIQYLMRI